jgi:hypothetical protein
MIGMNAPKIIIFFALLNCKLHTMRRGYSDKRRYNTAVKTKPYSEINQCSHIYIRGRSDLPISASANIRSTRGSRSPWSWEVTNRKTTLQDNANRHERHVMICNPRYSQFQNIELRIRLKEFKIESFEADVERKSTAKMAMSMA